MRSRFLLRFKLIINTDHNVALLKPIDLHYNIQTLNSLHWFFRRKISKLQPHRTFSRSRSNIIIIREWSIEPIDLLRVMIAHLEIGESEKLVSGK